MDWIIAIGWIAVLGVCLELLARREERRGRELNLQQRKAVYDAPYVFSYLDNDFRFIELYTPNPRKCASDNYRFDDNGFRLDSYNVRLNRPDEADQIWIFGGSTCMGLCVKEDDTVAAHLNRLLDRDGSETRVVNMGIGGYSSTNELLLLIELLRAGHRPRGIAVYDGINEKPAPKYFRKWQKDSAFADECRLMRSGRARSLRRQFDELKLWLKTNLRAYDYVAELKRQRLRSAKSSEPLSYPGDWDPVVAQYTRTLLMIRGVCEAYGIFSLFFFQPVLQYEVHYRLRRLSDYETTHLLPKCRQNEFERREVLYRSHIGQLRAVLGDDHVDLYDVFAGRDGERLYDDPRHPNGEANHLVAQAIYGPLRGRLHRVNEAKAPMAVSAAAPVS